MSSFHLCLKCPNNSSGLNKKEFYLIYKQACKQIPLNKNTSQVKGEYCLRKEEHIHMRLLHWDREAMYLHLFLLYLTADLNLNDWCDVCRDFHHDAWIHCSPGPVPRYFGNRFQTWNQHLLAWNTVMSGLIWRTRDRNHLSTLLSRPSNPHFGKPCTRTLGPNTGNTSWIWTKQRISRELKWWKKYS